MGRPTIPDGVLIAAHRRLSGELGRAPTRNELGQAVGLTDQATANRMAALGLARSIQRVKLVSDVDVLKAHERLTDELGRAPTSTELSRRIGLCEPSTSSRMRTLGLARTHMTRSEAGRMGADSSNAQRARRRAERRAEDNQQDEHKTEQDGILLRMNAEKARKARYYAAWRGEGKAAGTPGETHGIAGALYAPGERARVRCAICNRDLVITPRTHPWYMRDSDGVVRWLCSEQCMRGCDG